MSVIILDNITPSLYENLLMFFNMKYGTYGSIYSAAQRQDLTATTIYYNKRTRTPEVTLICFGNYYRALIESDVMLGDGWYGNMEATSGMYGYWNHGYMNVVEDDGILYDELPL